MRIATPFYPIEVGEVDTFAFDMTARVGASQIVLTTWTCRLTPFSAGADPTPNLRIGNTWFATTIDYFGQQKTGWFVYAQVGPMPASAAGGTYILDAEAWLADGRIIADNASVPCVLPGQ